MDYINEMLEVTHYVIKLFSMLYPVLFFVAALCIRTSYGDDPLQSLIYNLECYNTTQEGCNVDFTTKYPDLSRSYDNTTEASTRFYLFTNDNLEVPELIHKCGGGLPPGTKFNPNCTTIIIIPGFVSGVCIFAIYREIKNEILKCGCFNVILVDWTWGNSFDLKTAMDNLKIVANQTVEVIRNLTAEYPGIKIKLIGHSLGAHVCGLVGKEVPVEIIIGLDPAGVGSEYGENAPLDGRLDATDAKYVQVTHCNGGQCLPSFGVNYSCGTKDFWFNDGLNQPSCYPQIFISLLKGDYIYALLSLIYPACQHFQCLQYYKVSLCGDGCPFIGVKCKDAKTFWTSQNQAIWTSHSCGSGVCDVASAHSCDCSNGTNVVKNNYCMKTSLCCPYCGNLNAYSCPATQSYTCPA